MCRPSMPPTPACSGPCPRNRAPPSWRCRSGSDLHATPCTRGRPRPPVRARLAGREPGGALEPFHARVRPEALGYRLGAYVTVQVVQRSLADVGEALADIPEVLEVTALSGVADLLVRVVATDADDLWRITEHLLSIPGVQRTDTALALRRLVAHRMAPLL